MTRKKIFNLILKFSLCCFSILFLSFASLFIYYSKDLPRPEKFTEKQFTETTNIYDKTGDILLYKIYGEEKRTIVNFNSISEYLKQAIISAEDKNFYNHYGIDFNGTARAIIVNIQKGKLSQGGSTISQQLIRSTFLTRDKTIKRKIKEYILTIEIERRYSKDQIFEWYLNQVPFGNNAYGAEAASQTFFKKPVSDISLEQAALLASLIQAPTYFSPYGENTEKLFARKNNILDKMAKQGYISKEQAEEAKNKKIDFVPNIIEIKAPHFTLFIKQYLETKYGEYFLKEKGLNVYTSLDWEIQQIAEQAVIRGAENNKNYNAHNVALTAINPQTGEILAMVGSKNWQGEQYPKNCVSGKTCLFEPKLNATTYGIGRQPGSAFKPFAYITAFQKGYNSDTIITDEETNFGVWGGKEYIPKNYNNIFRGDMTLRTALAQSVNIPAIKVLLNLAGLDDTIQLAKDLGLTTLKPPYGPSIVLGGKEVRLLDMTSAYGVFASEGLKISPVSILKITDKNGNIIEENKKIPKRVLGIKETKILNDILSDNEARAPMFGSNSSLYIKDYKVSVKTGTTQEYKDAWTIGYTPSLVCGVWVGNNNNAPMAKKPSVVLASPIWKEFMEKTLILKK
ncbi:MAG: PBP1A family penicillin-binding protein [Patescibacteria group bacterium]|nr:PBP1A family penicillin-binding protein [Patescibacteria group bacterium]